MLNAGGKLVRGACGGGVGPGALVRLSVLVVALVMALPMMVVVGGCAPVRSTAPARPGPHVSQPEEKHELTEEDVTAWLDGKIPDAHQGIFPERW